MNERKIRCSKCGAMKVVFVAKSADPFDTKPARYICKKCGQEYPIDSGINVVNDMTINTFPNPKIDLDVDDSFTKKIKSKR